MSGIQMTPAIGEFAAECSPISSLSGLASRRAGSLSIDQSGFGHTRLLANGQWPMRRREGERVAGRAGSFVRGCPDRKKSRDGDRAVAIPSSCVLLCCRRQSAEMQMAVTVKVAALWTRWALTDQLSLGEFVVAGPMASTSMPLPVISE